MSSRAPESDNAVLTRLLKPPVSPTGPVVNWANSSLPALPRDYRAFIDTYGLGCVDGFLWVLHPEARNPYLNLGRPRRVQADAITESITAYPEDFPDLGEPSNLIPWAITDNGGVCWWHAAGAPDTWPVIVAAVRSHECVRYQKTMTQLLAGLLSGSLVCELLPDDWPRNEPMFESVEDAPPRPR